MLGTLRMLAVCGVLGASILFASCASAPPSVRPQAPGRGKDPATAVAPSSGCAAEQGSRYRPSSATTLLIESGGVVRRAMLRLPDEVRSPAPLLVSLHPFSLGANAWESYSGLAEAAAGRGYVVVSPEGSQPGPRWAVPGGLDTGVDDIGFIDDLLDELEGTLCIDRNAEFAAGFSAGAAMAQALSCTMPWRFAAIAGSGGVNLTDTCPDSPGTSTFILHGTADPIAPAAGSQIVFAPPLGLSVNEVADVDAARAGCDRMAERTAPVNGVRARVFTGCDDDHRVQQWDMVGAGHTWAGARPLPFDLIVGPTASDFSANEVILDFFRAT